MGKCQWEKSISIIGTVRVHLQEKYFDHHEKIPIIDDLSDLAIWMVKLGVFDNLLKDLKRNDGGSNRELLHEDS